MPISQNKRLKLSRSYDKQSSISRARFEKSVSPSSPRLKGRVKPLGHTDGVISLITSQIANTKSSKKIARVNFPPFVVQLFVQNLQIQGGPKNFLSPGLGCRGFTPYSTPRARVPPTVAEDIGQSGAQKGKGCPRLLDSEQGESNSMQWSGPENTLSLSLFSFARAVMQGFPPSLSLSLSLSPRTI